MEVKVGCSENVIEVPLLAELNGYGPYLGRRNLGVRDPLYARALTVYDGQSRNVIIVTDTVTMDELECRQLRAEMATEFILDPEGIMFIGTHTHSAPCIRPPAAVGYGDRDEQYVANWRAAIRKSVREALANEEPVRAFAGKAPIHQQIAERRTTSADKSIDPDIRWVKMVRPDGSVKVLLHNYSMHGVVFGSTLFVSADWMGDANRKIKERKLADLAFFMYGTAGDLNAVWSQPSREREVREKELDWITDSYVDDLESGLANGEEIQLTPISCRLKATLLPTEDVNPVEYREMAEKIIAKVPDRNARPANQVESLLFYIHARLVEMAVLAERGHDFRVIRDLQALRMGDLAVYAVPGEPFLSMGEELRRRSPFKFPIAVSVANGSGGYFPTPEMFEQYPSMFACDDFGAFGFFEVWAGFFMLRARYKSNITPYIIDNLLNLQLG